MGGGIALGTFNGAALSEAVKLALLRGKDSKGKPFESVEIDVFSGASAGSMSLALMLRALVYITNEQREQAKAKLIKQFGSEFENLNLEGVDLDERKEDLITAQAMQDVQYQAWVKDVNLKRLLARNKKGPIKKRLKHTAGILNRSTVDEIAKKHIQFDSEYLEQDPGFSKRRLLADRVLYASALTNLTPIINDARKELPTVDSGQAVLADGMTSKTHRELRVFDLYFGEYDAEYYNNVTKHPNRWIRYHTGEPFANTVGKLGDPSGEAWAKMAATAVASGAFPFAFEPVVLERRDYEFSNLWPKELKDKGQKSVNFTYTDGGTFNNEPIREAFRMASFIDAHDDRENTDRWIVFVDPYVSDMSTEFGVPVHQRFSLEDPSKLFSNLDGFDLEPRYSLDRLIPHAFSMLNSISNQSRLIEGDKVFNAHKKFKLRDELRPIMKQSLSENPARQTLKQLAEKISSTLETNRKRTLIPPGALTLNGELRRIIREVRELSLIKGRVEELSEYLGGSLVEIEHLDLWHQALSFIMLDLTLDLSGKNERAKLVSIGPLKNPSKNPSVKAQKIPLPGERLGAFGGFTYEKARHVDTLIGQWCAEKFLSKAGLIEATNGSEPVPRLDKLDEEKYRVALEKGSEQLLNRIFEMIADGHAGFISAVPKPVMSWLFKSKILKPMLDKEKTVSYEFRIKLPDGNYDNFEWDGPGAVYGDNDIKPIKQDDGYYLVSFAHFEKNKWKGAHVKKQCLEVDMDGLLIDTEFCRIELPAKEELEKIELYGSPVFMCEIKNNDKSKKLPASRWKGENMAQPLFNEFLNY